MRRPLPAPGLPHLNLNLIWNLTLTLTLLTLTQADDAVFLSPGKPTHQLTLSDRILFRWQLDYAREIVEIEVEYRPEVQDDWVGVGFSNNGELRNADLCIFWADWTGQRMLQDVHTSNNSLVLPEQSQDCDNFQYTELQDGVGVYAYQRRWDTCHDDEDYVIQDGTTHLVWTSGQGPLSHMEGLDVGDIHQTGNGFQRVRLLKVEDIPPLPEDARTLEITHQLDLPSDDTTYWCSVHKLPRPLRRRKHHIVRYEPVISAGNEHILHHMEVFHCAVDASQEMPLWAGPCGDPDAPQQLQKCKKVLAAWAIGAGPFNYPEEAGLAIGGEDFNPYIMLEVHYNNEKKESGKHDHSGMRLHVTSQLRPYDAGIMELGLVYTDKMAIPPGQTDFPLTGLCLPECTQSGLPSSGIMIFGSQLHTHGTGSRVFTKHFRQDVELPELNRDNHYSTHFQEIRELREPRLIMPGDTLATTCVYNTLQRADNITLGGYGFSEEMCLNYVHYYPKVELEVCKSAVDDKALEKYLKFEHDWDNQNTNPWKSVAENFRSIHWTPSKAAFLQEYYEALPVQMQCQSGSGGPLPGHWTDMKTPLIRHPLPLPKRPSCTVAETISAEKRHLALMKVKVHKRMAPSTESVALMRENGQTKNLGDHGTDHYKDKRTNPLYWIISAPERLVQSLEKRSNSPMKRVGHPFNEMKRVGSPFIEMKRNKVPGSYELQSPAGHRSLEKAKKTKAESEQRIQAAIQSIQDKSKRQQKLGLMNKKRTPMSASRLGDLKSQVRDLKDFLSAPPKRLDQRRFSELQDTLNVFRRKRMPETLLKRVPSGISASLSSKLAKGKRKVNNSNLINLDKMSKGPSDKRSLKADRLSNLAGDLQDLDILFKKSKGRKRGLNSDKLYRLNGELQAFGNLGNQHGAKRDLGMDQLSGLEEDLGLFGANNKRSLSMDKLSGLEGELNSFGGKGKRGFSMDKLSGLEGELNSFGGKGKRSLNMDKLSGLEGELNSFGGKGKRGFSMDKLSGLAEELNSFGGKGKRDFSMDRLHGLEGDLNSFGLANQKKATKRASGRLEDLERKVNEAFEILSSFDIKPEYMKRKVKEVKRAYDKIEDLENKASEAYDILGGFGIKTTDVKRQTEPENLAMEEKRSMGGSNHQLKSFENQLHEAFGILNNVYQMPGHGDAAGGSKRSPGKWKEADLRTMESNIGEAFNILKGMGINDDFNVKKKSDEGKDEDEYYEYEDEDLSKYWSDYDPVGIDKKNVKRGLGSIV